MREVLATKNTKDTKKTWPMVRLGDVCEVVLGGTPKTGITEYWDGDIPWLTPGDMGKITQMYVDASNCKRKISQLGLDNGSTLCPARSVILSTRAPIGYAFVNSVPMATNQGCKTLVPSDDVYPEYLCFNLLGRTDELNELGTGTTFKELATGRLKAMTLPLPPLSVQREIVARLERELAAVEKMKKGFEALAETARAEFKAELKEVFEDSRYALEPLSKYCSFTGGSQPPKSSFIYEPKDGYVRLYQIRDYNGDPKPTYIKASDAKKTSRRGDIMIGRYGASIGLVFWAEDGAYNVAMVKVLINSSAILPEFVFEALHTPRIQSVFRSASRNAQAGFNESEWNKMKLPFPPLADQREVVARLDGAKAKAEKLAAKAQAGVAVCETMRKAILKEAFDDGRASPAIGKVAGR